MEFTILIVDDEKEMCISLSEILSANGYKTIYTIDPLMVVSIINKNKINLIIMDIKMPNLKGMDLLKNIKNIDSTVPIIMITGFPSIDNAVNSMKYGALNFYVKPIDIKELLKEIGQLAGSRIRINVHNDFNPIISQNAKMKQIMAEISKVAPTNAPVLITGDSGTGKELVASSIHYHSKRKTKAFIRVNCASIPDTLLESELFGHEKGAFTDAINKRIGKFEQANEGTIFFDEIGDMSQKTQPKLLRVIQDGEIQRLGSMESLQTNVRIISATNKNLNILIDNNHFREDLFYRLSVITIHLPPLRERKDDLDVLIKYFLEFYNKSYNKDIKNISSEVKKLFYNHNWPGNIRELKNCIERAVIFVESEDRELNTSHLPSQYREIKHKYVSDSLEEIYDNLSKEKIAEALARTNGVKHKAAKLLNIHRKTLYNKMKKLGME